MMQSVRPQRSRTPAPKPVPGPSVGFYQDRKGDWRWRVKARNGKIVADSAEGYSRKAGARRAWRGALATFNAAQESQP